MPAHRRYTKKQQADGVGLSEVIGIRPAAATIGVPESTLRHWREKPEMAQLRAEKKVEVALDVWAGFQHGVRRTVQLMDTTEDLGKVAVATGILYDKYALMSGEATARTELHDWKFDDHEQVERAGAFLVEELARRTDESAAEAAVGTAGETGAETPTG